MNAVLVRIRLVLDVLWRDESIRICLAGCIKMLDSAAGEAEIAKKVMKKLTPRTDHHLDHLVIDHLQIICNSTDPIAAVMKCCAGSV